MAEQEIKRKITISDIAKMCGVSKATVSRVINGETGRYSAEVGEKVRETMREVGYRPLQVAQGLAKRKTRAIGLMIPESSSDFYSELSRGIQCILYEKKYEVLLCHTSYAEKGLMDVTNSLLSHPVSGIITACGWPEIDEVPVVHVDRHMNEHQHYGVYFPNRDIFYKMTSMFYQCGHRNIAMIAGPMNTSTAVFRLQGYMKFMGEEGRKLPTLVEFGDYTIESGYWAADRLVKREVPFSVLLVANDYMAIGAMKRLKEQGIQIPQDVEVMGIDNLSLCDYVTPQLSSISQKTFEMGYEAGRLMLQILDGKYKGEELVRLKIEPEWIFRESTDPSCARWFAMQQEKVRI